jgi:hypothetical protein
VLQAGRENRLGLFGKLELVEGAVDFGFVAAFGMIFEADTDGLAVGGQCLEGETPALCFSQTLAQFASLEIVMPAFSGNPEIVRRIRCSDCPFLSLRMYAVFDHHEPNNDAISIRLTRKLEV